MEMLPWSAKAYLTLGMSMSPNLRLFSFSAGSVKLFSSLVPTLLGRNQRIEVWELEPDSSSRWRIRCSASPGNVEGLISDIENGEFCVS